MAANISTEHDAIIARLMAATAEERGRLKAEYLGRNLDYFLDAFLLILLEAGLIEAKVDAIGPVKPDTLSEV